MRRPLSWWQSTFNHDYLEIYGPHLEERAALELDGLRRLCPMREGASLLDLGCGQGRHSVALAALGLRVTALDQSKELLHRARQRPGAAQVDFVQGDFRDLKYQQKFDTVISLYNSLGYYSDEEDNQRVLQRIWRSLKPGGHLFVDLLGMQDLQRHLGHHRVGDFEEEVILDAARSRLRLYQRLRGRPYVHDLRIYRPEEFAAQLEAAGFRTLSQWGGFDGCPCHQGERLITLARRGEP